MEEFNHGVVSFVLHLPIEAVHLVHVDGLVVPPRKVEMVGK